MASPFPINPDRPQFEALQAIAASGDDPPVVMLNLNRYRERAHYDGEPPGGGDPEVTGREAYERYAEVALRVLTALGGEIVWHGKATLIVVGEEDERWDEVIAVRYPSTQAFLDLATDGEILAALAHREAGLERASLIRCVEAQ